MAITTGNSWHSEIVWTLDEQSGPTGRTAKTTVNAAKLVAQTSTNDEGEEVTNMVEQSWYDRPRTVVLYRAGKAVAQFNNVTQYFAEQLAENWVDQGE